MSKKTFSFIILLIILGYFVYTHLPEQFSASSKERSSNHSGCYGYGPIQDRLCAGAVNPELTKDLICSPDFTTKTVRNFPADEKKQVYEEYGILCHTKGEYEVDHLISLELGGSNEIANLWPELADPRPGFHEKDTVENYLHRQVCSGAISLSDTQREVANNWIQVYQSMQTSQ